MDERKNDGKVDENSTKDYKARAPGILTVLQNEVALRLGLDVLDELKNLDTDIDLDDGLCTTVLPYGLASRLLMQEDLNLSTYFSNLYEMYLTNYTGQFKPKGKIVKIKDVYGSSMRVGD